MKLYATTTSERASKGQGGNKKIVIDLLVGDSKENRTVARIVLLAEGADYSISYYDIENDRDIKMLQRGRIKNGKQEKGEICRKCEEEHKDGIFHTCPDNQ